MSKKTVITGATSGVGKATAIALARHGHELFLVGRSQQKLHDTQKEIKKALPQTVIHVVVADFCNLASVHSAAQEIATLTDYIDVLINNAGVFLAEDRNGTDDAWREVWARTLQINLISTANLCREAINHWLKTGVGGAIVNVASRAAFRGDDPDHWSYAASKGAMVSLTKTLARAYSGNGIYSYGIAPGFVLTDMVQSEFEREPGLAEHLLKDIPYGAFAPATEIASAICFFASGMATHATGQTLDINGASYVR